MKSLVVWKRKLPAARLRELVIAAAGTERRDVGYRHGSGVRLGKTGPFECVAIYERTGRSEGPDAYDAESDVARAQQDAAQPDRSLASVLQAAWKIARRRIVTMPVVAPRTEPSGDLQRLARLLGRSARVLESDDFFWEAFPDNAEPLLQVIIEAGVPLDRDRQLAGDRIEDEGFTLCL